MGRCLRLTGQIQREGRASRESFGALHSELSLMAPFHQIQSISFKYVQNHALARHRSCPGLTRIIAFSVQLRTESRSRADERRYFTLIRSTSKISVAPGGMSAPAPLAP